MTEPLRSQLPHGYRQALVTAITVFLGFSLSFMRFWGLEAPGEWTGRAIFSASVIAVGIVVEIIALLRSLALRDEEPRRYAQTVRWFAWGIVIVTIGVIATFLVAAHPH